MINNIEARIEKYIKNNNLIATGDKVLAAVSGGADSICMLLLLKSFCDKYGNRLGVIHVNHGFRPESADEAIYVKQFCDAVDVPFFLKEIKPGACKKTEEEARTYRYNLIKEVAVCEDYNKIALAHNAQDRSETMLFNLFRGTGITGLSSIRPQRDEYIRPILPLNRLEIEKFLENRNVSYVVDSSNLSDAYDRNKIRHHIIPKALEINESAISHMYEAAEKLAKIDDYLESVGKRAYESIVHPIQGGNSFLISDYQKEDEVIRKILIRRALCGMSPHLKDITAEHLEAVDRLGMSESGNKHITLPYGILVYREYDKLVMVNQDTDSIDSECIDISDMLFGKTIDVKAKSVHLRFNLVKRAENKTVEELDIPRNKYTKWFDYDKMKKRLTLRIRSEKDYIIISKDGHKKMLNRLMIDSKIPARMRDKIPLISAEDEIIWVIGYRDSARYMIDANTENILEVSVVED